MAEAVADPHMPPRAILHRFDGAPGIDGPFAVPVAAFKFAHGGPRVDSAPRPMGADTEAVLQELGYGVAEVAGLRAAKVI
jgi:crotonobetainyl-CoA:carnitine CoA-transferase CaiB-like acyl-CoA transferase